MSSSLGGLLEYFGYLLLQLWIWVQDRRKITIGAILGLIVLYTARYFASPYRKLPPGPRGYPIIGNLLEMRDGQWLKFSEWHKKYGDLIYLNAAGQPVVVINSSKVGVALLDRRAAIYSDRPRFIVASDIMTGGLFFGVSRYGDTYRRMRKAANEKLSTSSVKEFYDTQMKEAIVQACDLVDEPARWDRHFRRTAASATLSIVYGHPTLTSEQDHIVRVINDFSERLFHAMGTGAHLVEFFPWLRHFPSSLAKWKRDAEALYKQDSKMFEGLLHTVETNVAKGDDHQSVAATLIREVERNKLSSKERSWLAGNLYVGGADTSSVMMSWWTLAILAYPETQARAHAELDAVIGRTRLPTFADYPHLPYIRAMVKELLRWRPIAPIIAPHRCTEDDWYEGMFIPKGTICLPNAWHMNRDPEIFGKNTEDFDPARYLDASGSMAPDFKKDGHFSYGFGSRICVGRHMADNALFINIAILLWAMKIERMKDASGRFLPLDVDGWVDGGLIVHPVPFEVKFTPRFPDAPAMLGQERELRGL
ncbi:cytochrome P450 [Russula aff. rugulosa BPL654]|nr:cytochrome P450 [Russula aff. rugulosa BPL654]